MRRDETPHDPTPDPQLAAALRSLEAEPPLESLDWERLRGTLRERAELPLARRRGRAAAGRVGDAGRPRSRALRPLLPLAAAASIALAVWLGTGSGSPEGAPPAPLTAEEVFGPDLSEQEFRLLVSGGGDPEALLLIALDES